MFLRGNVVSIDCMCGYHGHFDIAVIDACTRLNLCINADRYG